jgi:hypothetical protein
MNEKGKAGVKVKEKAEVKKAKSKETKVKKREVAG